MKMCQPHWDALREAVKTKGMWHLVSRNGEEAAERAQRLSDKKRDADPKDYDPLFDTHMMIMSNALQAGGTYLMGTKEDGSEYCCLCELDAHKDQMGEGSKDWIEKATDGALQYCREKGLVGVH
jgi:hypothetical protein